MRGRPTTATSLPTSQVKTATKKTATKKTATKKTATKKTIPHYPLVAVMDVGSRALRLGIGEVVGGGQIRRLETLNAPVAIGMDTFARGRIRATTTEAVVHTLEDFTHVLRDYGLAPRDVRAVATSAIRDAPNREVFLDRVEKRTGFHIEVVDAIEETRMAQQLVRHLIGKRLDEGVVMMLAFGGGGTQIIVQRAGGLELAESRDFGILKLQESGASEAALRSARRFLPKVVESISRVHDLRGVERIVIVSADVYHFVAGLAKVTPRPWGLELSRRAYDRLVARVGTLRGRDVAELLHVDRDAADLACMAFEELRAFAAPCRFKSILLPKCSMLDSVMLDRALTFDDDSGSWARDLPATVEAAAWAVARKYRISEAHVRQVRKLALQLFDGLTQLTGLDERARLLLSVAAILHDIGIFVGTHDHERHSSYLIRNSEVMGLDSAELQRVALMVRHHRHPFRDIDSRDLGPLASAERVEVLKLTALLRIADALDTNHVRRAFRLRVETTHEELRVIIETRAGDREGFFDLKRAFDQKADLAEEVFGMKLTLIEVLAA